MESLSDFGSLQSRQGQVGMLKPRRLSKSHPHAKKPAAHKRQVNRERQRRFRAKVRAAAGLPPPGRFPKVSRAVTLRERLKRQLKKGALQSPHA